MWLDHLPAFGHHDRIVSFGGIGMISRDLARGRLGPADIGRGHLEFRGDVGNGSLGKAQPPK